ncbi:MAG: hypothetical protein ACK4NR_09970 [Micavibrio sp.]
MKRDHFDRYWVESLSGDYSEFIYNKEQIRLPLPPSMAEDMRFEMEVYARFMRHLRHVPNSRMEIKILSAIQFTADIMDHGDALVAKTLVDLGLRAPRKAFPVSFLDFVDKCVQRRDWSGGSVPPASVLALKEHWDHIGENRFATAARAHYAVFNENMYVRA